MADSILFGELIERPSHGIARILPGSFGPMDEEPGPKPVIERTAPTAARITGNPGILVATIATGLVAEIANETGIGVVATTGSHATSGSLTYYVEKLTRQDLVAFVVTDTISFVTPEGGKQRILGTNPLAIGIPTEGYPFIADMATSAITGGEVLLAAATGTTIPDGVAVDADGNATTDPAAMLDGGSLLPFGGHKGLGLSMMVQLLSGVLGGNSDLPKSPAEDWNHVFIAISLSAFGEPESLKRHSQELIHKITGIDAKENAEIRVPGHRSLARRDAALDRGTVDLDSDTYAQLLALL